MRTRAVLLWCGAVLGAAAVLASCQSTDIDFNFLHDTYVREIAKMPPTVQPRIARPTGSGNAASMVDVTLAPRAFTGGLVKLSLSDVLHRALANSLDIKVNSYSPGISAQDIISAEAAFDTLFFSDVKVANLDQPENISDFGGGQNNAQTYDVGFKKLLDTGATIQAKYTTEWQWANEAFQKFNPQFDTDASLTLTQPLLQNFGTDVNKAQIRINKNKADISLYEFKRQVMATLFNVEQAYWNLYLARQTLAIGQELLARTEWSYATVVRRLVWDALPVNVSQAKSFVATRRAAVVRQANDVRDAEDTLKNLLNDPNLPLTSDIAMLPTEDPLTGALVLDPQQELWAGLEHRPELQEAELGISNANIAREVAKNLRLPKFDMQVQWDLMGLSGPKWSNSMEQIGNGDFNNVTVSLTLQWYIGDRAGRAGDRKAQRQQEQAALQYQEAASGVMTQIQIALRDVQTTYQEMEANREAVQAATEELSALVARRVGLTPDYLDLELRTQETQAAARRALIDSVARYNVAIVKLEQQKGTLLQYDRVDVAPD